MKKLNLQEGGNFSVTTRRYVLCGRKHGDTAYVCMKDMRQGVIYEVDDISWNDILLILIRRDGTWEDFIFDVI